MIRRLLAVAGVFALCMTLSACGGGGSADDPPGVGEKRDISDQPKRRAPGPGGEEGSQLAPSEDPAGAGG